MRICDYGCGKEAFYQFKNGKWCCCDHQNKCEAFSKSVSGEDNPFYGKTQSEEIKDKWKKSRSGLKGKDNGMYGRKGILNPFYKKTHSKEQKEKWKKERKGSQVGVKNNMYGKKHPNRLNINVINYRYPLFSKIEEMRYNPDKPEEKEIQVHCKNHNCSNSKEQGGWFTPNRIQLAERIRQIEDENGNGGSYFYCSKECKQECPLYGLRTDPHKDRELFYTKEEYEIWKNKIKELDNSRCQICGTLENIHVHHIIPKKFEPFLSLDIDNGICLCEKCHYKYGHKDECSTGRIAIRNCK